MNDALTTWVKVDVDSVDVVCAAVCRFMQVLSQWGVPSQIHGKTYDLKSAYRQIGIHPADLKYACVAVYDPNQKKPVVWQQLSMPFGARASVVAFVRCARALQWIANQVLHIPTTSFFDDFLLLARPQLHAGTARAFELMLDVLGWATLTVPSAPSLGVMSSCWVWSCTWLKPSLVRFWWRTPRNALAS